MRFCFRSTAIIVAVLAIAGAAPAFAQQAQPEAGQTNLKLPVNEVLLDMVVHDKGNKPVLDLQAADLTVTDSGQPVTLSQLRLVSGKQQDEPLVTLLFNRPGFDGQQKSSSSVAQDAGKRVREAAARLLKQFPDSGFRFAVMDVWGRLQLQQDFTSDRKAVNDAIAAAVQPGQYGVAVGVNPAETRAEKVAQSGQDDSGSAVSARERALADSIGTALVKSAIIYSAQHASTGLASLQALAESERGITGRKAVVYFTSASDLTGVASSQQKSDLTPEVKAAIQSVVGAANRAELSIYVVRMDDASASDDISSTLNSYSMASVGSSNGGPPKSNTSSSGAATNGLSNAVGGQFASMSAFQAINSKLSGTAAAPGSLSYLVSGAGGYSFSEDDSFAAPVKELVNDMTTYYVASYVPPAGKGDGTFHSVNVTPVRSGLRIRTRSGYSAAP